MNLVQQSVKQISNENTRNYYDVSAAEDELFDMLQTNGLMNKKQQVLDFIKRITGENNDSYKIRQMGRFLSDLFNELKIHYKIKE